MASAHEAFWTSSSYAFVGHSATKGFPRISYGELKKHGTKKIFAVDPSVDQIEGQQRVSTGQRTGPDGHVEIHGTGRP